MFEWLTEAVNNVVEFFTGGQDDDDTEPDPCDVGNCVAALDTLATARRDVERACYFVNYALVPLRTAIWIISRPLWTYVVVLIVAFLVAGPIGVAIAIGVYLAALLFIRVWLPVINVLGQALADAFQAEVDAILAVQAECPADCQGDLDPSECDVMGERVSVPSNAVTNWLGLAGMSARFNGR